MSEHIEFVLQMKDMMSSVFPKVGAAAQSSFTKINSSVAQTQQALNTLSKPVKINVDNSGLEHTKSLLGSIVGGNLIAVALSRGLAGAKELVADSLQASFENGMRLKSFEVLTGSASTGRNLANQLRELKQNTIMGASVYQNAQTMLSFGIGQNDVLRKLREVGDVGMGEQERMASLTLARSQITAAGKLAGQDLLQLINAGFNPLQVMAANWQDFGFKAKVTIGQLKDMMEKGKISSGMVDKAFEVATSKGGQFYGMMDQMAETAGGKLQKLKGNFAALQIDLGNALMPLAEGFMEMASDMTHWLNISKTVPETLMAEKMEMQSLIGSITSLNEGNEVRSRMLDMLRGKFPDLFGNIDKEVIKNTELLDMLNKVNGAYEQRIAVASHAMAASIANKELNENIRLATALRNEAEHIRQTGKRGDLGLADIFRSGVHSDIDLFNPTKNVQVYLEAAKKLDSVRPGLVDQQDRAEKMKRTDDLMLLFDRAQQLTQPYTSPDMLKDMWGNGVKKNLAALTTELNKFKQLKGADGYTQSMFLGFDWTAIEQLLKGKAGSGNSNVASAVDEATRKVTSGGQKQININFRNMVENMYNNVRNGQELATDIENKLTDALTRTLASAAGNF